MYLFINTYNFYDEDTFSIITTALYYIVIPYLLHQRPLMVLVPSSDSFFHTH